MPLGWEGSSSTEPECQLLLVGKLRPRERKGLTRPRMGQTQSWSGIRARIQGFPSLVPRLWH